MAPSPLSGLALLGLALPAAGLRLHEQKGALRAANAAGLRPLKEGLLELGALHGGSAGKVCLTVPGPFMGRLSNTVAMMNMVLRAALETGVTFDWPKTYTSWMRQEGFDGIFGSSADVSCESHKVEAYSPVCPPEIMARTKPPAAHGRCKPNELVLDTTAHHTVDSQQLCGCEHAVIVNGSELFWDHDYSKTFSVLQRRYWQSHTEPLLLPALGGHGEPAVADTGAKRVVVHVRLGDIEFNCSQHFTVYNCVKKLPVDLFEQILAVLSKVLPPSCMHVNLVTDGHLDSPDIVHLSRNLTGSGHSVPQVWTGDLLSTAKTFELMTHSDVLVFGSSGFGHLAAILARPDAARVGAPQPVLHEKTPFPWLPNTTQLYSASDTDLSLDAEKALKSLRENEAIQALASKCHA